MGYTKSEIVEGMVKPITGDKNTLTTTDKTNLVAAINETQSDIDTLAANVAGINNAPSRLFLFYNFT